MVDVTSIRGRHSWVAIFFDSLDSTSKASLPQPPNTSTTKGMQDHPLKAHELKIVANCFNNVGLNVEVNKILIN